MLSFNVGHYMFDFKSSSKFSMRWQRQAQLLVKDKMILSLSLLEQSFMLLQTTNDNEMMKKIKNKVPFKWWFIIFKAMVLVL
jgi:hypothetical protein